nr:hypothetical protein Iba_chr05cCG4650 [Ipomoea batatas]
MRAKVKEVLVLVLQAAPPWPPPPLHDGQLVSAAACMYKLGFISFSAFSSCTSSLASFYRIRYYESYLELEAACPRERVATRCPNRFQYRSVLCSFGILEAPPKDSSAAPPWPPPPLHDGQLVSAAACMYKLGFISFSAFSSCTSFFSLLFSSVNVWQHFFSSS